MVEQANVETATIENQTWGAKLTENKLIVTAPKTNVQGKEYEEQIYIKIFSKEGYCRVVKLPVKLLTTKIDANSAIAWQHFKTGENNVLPDYSYAGYNHGESAPQGAFSLGYQVINVKERMTAKNMTAREALISILQEKGMTKVNGTNKLNANAKIVIYSPQATTFFTTMTTTPATKASRRTPLTRKTTMSAVALKSMAVTL